MTGHWSMTICGRKQAPQEISQMSRDDEIVVAMLKDCTEASIALADWFASQQIPPARALIVLGIMLTSLTDTNSGLTDKKVDKALHHIRALTRAVHARRRRK
jgi:hypothetical protein